MSEFKIINKVYFSPGEECKKAIIDQLNGAEFSVKICVFTISDNDISKAIKNAYKRGLEVKIITDNDKVNDRGSDIYTLFKAGIEVKTDSEPSHMHHKFAVIDEKTLITGSFNWTRSASLYNQENVVVTNNSDLVDQHVDYYKELWGKMMYFY